MMSCKRRLSKVSQSATIGFSSVDNVTEGGVYVFVELDGKVIVGVVLMVGVGLIVGVSVHFGGKVICWGIIAVVCTEKDGSMVFPNPIGFDPDWVEVMHALKFKTKQVITVQGMRLPN
jgi:hypothetical protein